MEGGEGGAELGAQAGFEVTSLQNGRRGTSSCTHNSLTNSRTTSSQIHAQSLATPSQLPHNFLATHQHGEEASAAEQVEEVHHEVVLVVGE